MRDTFVADVSDFLKFGLLNVLAGKDLQLGIVWYTNPDTKRLPADLLVHNPSLFRQLLAIRSRRHGTAAIEDSEVLPPSTLYYRAPVPLPLPRKGRANAARTARVAERSAWLEGALELLRPAQLIFFDPDSGLGDMSGVKVTETRARKFAFLHETAPFLKRGQSVVVFHYLGMQEASEAQMVRAMLKALDAGGAVPFAVRFRRGRGPRCVIVLPANVEQKTLLLGRALESAAGVWKGCWSVSDLGKFGGAET